MTRALLIADPSRGAQICLSAILFNAALGRQPAAEPATGTTSFDGGARQTPAPPSDPERDHNELLVAAARLRRTGAGDSDFAF